MRDGQEFISDDSDVSDGFAVAAVRLNIEHTARLVLEELHGEVDLARHEELA
jgi:hypothetical protein